MKKLVSAMLALVLALVPAVSIAETAYERYTNETVGYSIDYPADWTLVSRETLRDAATDGDAVIENRSLVEYYTASIERLDMALFTTEGQRSCVNITYTQMPRKVLFEDIVSSVYPAMLAQFKATFDEYAEVMVPTAEAAGSNELVKVAGTYSRGGAQFYLMEMFISSDSLLVAITFILGEEADLDAFGEIAQHMAASFAF